MNNYLDLQNLILIFLSSSSSESMKVPECSSIASSRNDWDICLVYFDFLLCCRDYLQWKKILISEELQILFKYKKQSSSFNLLVCCWWLLPFKFIVLNIRMQIFKFTDPQPYSWGQVCRMWDEFWAHHCSLWPHMLTSTSWAQYAICMCLPQVSSGQRSMICNSLKTNPLWSDVRPVTVGTAQDITI